jgi:hypothetical protein
MSPKTCRFSVFRLLKKFVCQSLLTLFLSSCDLPVLSILFLYSVLFYSACSHFLQVYRQLALLKIMKQSFKNSVEYSIKEKNINIFNKFHLKSQVLYLVYLVPGEVESPQARHVVESVVPHHLQQLGLSTVRYEASVFCFLSSLLFLSPATTAVFGSYHSSLYSKLTLYFRRGLASPYI